MQRFQLALGMGLAACLVGVARGLPPAATAEGRVRPPADEFGTDTLDLVARFDSGEALFASAVVHNFGLGDGHAKVEGYLLEPDGDLHRFARSEKHGEWTLSGNGGRMDLGQILVERTPPLRRLEVRKGGFGLDLRAPVAAPGLRPPDLTPGCGLELLELAGPVEGSWVDGSGGEPESLTGWAAWTQRWMDQLEVDCTLRRLELFVLERDLAVYFTEVLLPDGTARRWWAVAREGDAVPHTGEPRARARWRGEPEGYPGLLDLDVEGETLRLHAESRSPLHLVDPRPPLPFLLGRLLARRTDPRVAFGALAFQAELTEEGAEPRRLQGVALVKVSYLRRVAPGE